MVRHNSGSTGIGARASDLNGVAFGDLAFGVARRASHGHSSASLCWGVVGTDADVVLGAGHEAGNELAVVFGIVDLSNLTRLSGGAPGNGVAGALVVCLVADFQRAVDQRGDHGRVHGRRCRKGSNYVASAVLGSFRPASLVLGGDSSSDLDTGNDAESLKLGLLEVAGQDSCKSVAGAVGADVMPEALDSLNLNLVLFDGGTTIVVGALPLDGDHLGSGLGGADEKGLFDGDGGAGTSVCGSDASHGEGSARFGAAG